DVLLVCDGHEVQLGAEERAKVPKLHARLPLLTQTGLDYVACFGADVGQDRVEGRVRHCRFYVLGAQRAHVQLVALVVAHVLRPHVDGAPQHEPAIGRRLRRGQQLVGWHAVRDGCCGGP
ncbi:unnamed protein product, partial [Laminaria digitata]